MYYTNVYIVLFISVCVSDNLSHYCSFYTVKKIEICATQKDEWVRKTLELLRYETSFGLDMDAKTVCFLLF